MTIPNTSSGSNTYGNTGNRWWAGENITNQNSFRLSNFGSNNAPSGYQSFPSGNAADDAQIMASNPSADPSAPGVTVKGLHNIDWIGVHGPYPSQKAANAAIPAIQKANPAPGALSQATQASSIGDFLAGITSSALWVRIAKVVIGAVIMVTGLVHMTGATKSIPGAAGKAIAAAPFL